MRLSGFLELPQLADESSSPTWQARGGRWGCSACLSSSISFTIVTSPEGVDNLFRTTRALPWAGMCWPLRGEHRTLFRPFRACLVTVILAPRALPSLFYISLSRPHPPCVDGA